MKPTTLILFLIIIASSCTIEKRIHRPGWNVQWRAHNTVNKEQSTISPIAKIEIDQFEFQPLENRSICGVPIIDGGREDLEINEIAEDDYLDITDVFPPNTADTAKKRVETVNSPPSKASDQDATSRSDSREANKSRKNGMVLLIFGLFLIALAFGVMFVMVGASVTIAEALLTLALAALSGIFGLVFFVIGSSVIKKSKKKSSQNG